MFQKISTLSTITLLICLLATQAKSWNEGGHRLIGVMTYELLDPNTREKVIKALENHERFQEDFLDQIPTKVQTKEDSARWLFSQASVWPDIVKGKHYPKKYKKKFNHPRWHYINFPTYITVDDSTHFENIGLPVNIDSLWDNTLDEKNLNIVQALHKATSTINQSQATKKNKAVSLCWIFHLIEDAHQPLHSSALFTVETFPKGDKGGNRINTSKGKLHSFWDSRLGNAKSINTIKKRSTNLLENPLLKKLGVAAKDSTSYADWLLASWDLAWEYAYGDQIRDAVYYAEEDQEESIDKIQLSGDYIEDAEIIADEAAVRAAYRLKTLLETLY